MRFTRLAPNTESLYPGQMTLGAAAGTPRRRPRCGRPGPRSPNRAWSGRGFGTAAACSCSTRSCWAARAGATRPPLTAADRGRRVDHSKCAKLVDVCAAARRRKRRSATAGATRRLAARSRGVLRRPRLRPHRPPVPHAAARRRRPGSAPGPGHRPCRRRCASWASPAGRWTCSRWSPKDSPTREIAARLYLSPKTVERHVASLLARTGPGQPRRAGPVRSRKPGSGRALNGYSRPDAPGVPRVEDPGMETTARDRRRRLPPVDLRARRRARRLHLQPVPDRRRRAAAVPHRPAGPVPARVGGGRPGAAGASGCAGSASATSRPTSAAR